ncbi:hypothetical protein [Thermospira aquatica]|uniref:Lipoprotein n=1 Tax=Thermospira aquatica TaxID=2828656 RepID=A0AAX3BEP3_9SPIR|nr:hypothetical protein [Thermospira aquatica]URA10807.1 hypothetical protein KDW03_03100 [Thermospira aquatica]
MKRFLGLVLVLSVLAMFGCAQIDLSKVKDAPLFDATKVTVMWTADVPTSAPVNAGDHIIAVGEFGGASGGSGSFWGAPFKVVGTYGTAGSVTCTTLDSATLDDWSDTAKLDGKFVVGTNADPNSGFTAEINDGGNNFSILVVGVSSLVQGVEQSTANDGVTYIVE